MYKIIRKTEYKVLLNRIESLNRELEDCQTARLKDVHRVITLKRTLNNIMNESTITLNDERQE